MKYLSVGVCQLFLDLLLFLLLQNFGVAIAIANTISRFCAAVAGYYLNKQFTFSVGHISGYSMMLRYWSFWIFMTFLSSVLILSLDKLMSTTLPTGLGKLVVELVLFLISFLISKFWVYKHASG